MDEDTLRLQAGCGCIGFIISLILSAVLGGYWRTEITYTAPIVENTANLSSFEENLNARHFLGGLIRGEQPNLDEALSKHAGKGKRLKQFTVITRHSIGDIGLTFVTLTIYSPVTVTVKGTVEDIVQPPAQQSAEPATSASGEDKTDTGRP